MISERIVLLAVMAMVTSVLAQEVYQPECSSWDTVVSQVQQHVNSNPLLSGSCTRRDDCTGASCALRFMSRNVNVGMRLFPCDDPPQMRVLFNGREETVTHGSTYSIPGLTVRLTPFMSFGVKLVVRLEAQDNGVVIGMDLLVDGVGRRYTLFDDVLIRTPPCTTPPDDCEALQILSDSVESPTSCAVKPSCVGVDCIGTYDITVQSFSTPVTVKSGLIIESCSDPISYDITAISEKIKLDWHHVFNESDTVHVDQELSFDLNLDVSVSMDPLDDLEHIRTTINYTLTSSSFPDTFTETILRDADVPIPQCREHPSIPTPTEPPPVNHSECASWKGLESTLQFEISDQYAVRDCVTIPGCIGFNCTAIYDGDRYALVVEEFHCESPPYILVSIDGPEEHFSQQFTHNETVPLQPGAPVSIVVHMVPETSTSIYLGVYLLYGDPSEAFMFPVIDDQLLEVSECPVITTSAMEATETPGQDITTSAMETTETPMQDKGGGKKPTGNPKESFTKKPDKKASNKPFVQPVKSGNSLGIGWTILLAILSAVILGSVMVAVFLFCRQRRGPNDVAFLLADTASSANNDEFSSSPSI